MGCWAFCRDLLIMRGGKAAVEIVEKGREVDLGLDGLRCYDI